MSESGKIITYNVSQDLNSVILILSEKLLLLVTLAHPFLVIVHTNTNSVLFLVSRYATILLIVNVIFIVTVSVTITILLI